VKKLAFTLAPERVFLFLALCYGTVLLLITPPFQAPDEPNHFYRAYQISEGRFTAVKQFPPVLTPAQKAERDREVRDLRRSLAKGDAEAVLKASQDLKYTGGVGGFLPESLVATAKAFFRLLNPENRQNVRDIFRLLALPLNGDSRLFVHFPNTALYSPIPYLPQAFGIALGKILHSSPLALMYWGRIANLFFWVFLVYLSIKIIPVCKWLLFLLALMPMSLFQAASLSADSFTNGISFLLISVFLRYAFDESCSCRLYISTIAIFVISLLLSLSKQAYFLMPLLFLLIPVDKIGTKRKFYAIFSLLCLLNVSAILLWTLVADVYKDIYTLYNAIIPTLSAEKQTLYVVSHPLQYCKVLAMTFMQSGRHFMDSFVGQLGWLDTDLPELFRVSYIVMLFAAVLSERRENIVFSLKQRGIILATLLMSILVISTLAFIGWTPVGGRIINVQGRYFIPVSPLFFLLFYKRKIRLNLNSIGAQLTILCYSLFSLTYTAYVIIKRYYIV
jgi:uncharacterized membrane protein